MYVQDPALILELRVGGVVSRVWRQNLEDTKQKSSTIFLFFTPKQGPAKPSTGLACVGV